MSRPGASLGRNLTLTEELEKLEQSITLTLQEIDHNFSKAHRIVTTNILPLVEQYGEQSNAVWEASKFWKQFFEASANVSLSGYEELAAEEDETTAAEETTLDETTTTDYHDTSGGSAAADATAASTPGYRPRAGRGVGDDDSLLDGGRGEDATELSGSTPRPPASQALRPQFAEFDSPYERLRRELKGEQAVFKDDADPLDDGDATAPQLPAHRTRLPDMSMAPRSPSSSLLLEEPAAASAAGRPPNRDPLLHRLLDRNYRLQATPHKGAGALRGRAAASPERRGSGSGGREPEDDADRERRALWAESPASSPEMAVPKLRSDLYMSPVRLRLGRAAAAAAAAPRTPGVSVQTPGTARKTRDVFAEAKGKGLDAGAARGKEGGAPRWSSDEDDDDDDEGFAGMSPPKTIQFALPPSKLMQTPAREASRRIVDDILITAGAEPDSSEYSPTLVKMNQDILDDTF
ncbi:hypothetical protein GGS23DRAFT_610998 [Durotheca rogersii]|uniref:uncharacterized protein n=1 Tax=Durotheca rogersii TaxID=419775 RepID=UPI00221F0C7B|nr:uncharacterized protein GGS23DRAFT_610998 [Durotheca rogersii]KAI5861887.1 hypothetical protein GGS23DRAFT_610998 [Durotheca rogersii]